MTGYTLITEGTRPFAQRLARQLPAGYRILFGAANEMPEVLLRNGNYVRVPQADALPFAHEMLKICLDRGVERLIPLGKRELRPLLEAKVLFLEYGIRVLLPEKRVFDTLMLFENPPVQLPVLLMEDGRSINRTMAKKMDASLSGVFIQSDSGDEVALCCLSD